MSSQSLVPISMAIIAMIVGGCADTTASSEPPDRDTESILDFNTEDVELEPIEVPAPAPESAPPPPSSAPRVGSSASEEWLEEYLAASREQAQLAADDPIDGRIATPGVGGSGSGGVNGAGYPKNQYVPSYYRDDGTYVQGYWRNSPSDGRQTCSVINC